METSLFKKLLEQQLLTQKEFENVEQQQNSPVSVFWDVTTILYLGVLLITTGLSILVYTHIDTIGHSVIVTAIGLICAACFIYCFSKAKGFSPKKVETPEVLVDYVLLSACLLILSFLGYLQFAYNLFGNNWCLATFVPMVILFFAAYYFDHLGVLSMAVTNLAAWAGFTVAPTQILRDNDFGNDSLVYTGLILGGGLLAIAFVSIFKGIKVHFASTYKNFGIHILFISLLGGMFHFRSVYLIWFVILAIAMLLISRNAIAERSFYFLVVSVLYAYIGLSYVLVDLLNKTHWSEGNFYVGCIYFIASGIGLIAFFIYFNKLLKTDAHI